jgi:hypothetical protein
MERKNKRLLLATMALLVLAGGTISGSGCSAVGPNGQQGVETLEQMTDTEFARWKLYITLGVKIGANRLLAEDIVTEEELDLAASVLESVRDQSITPGATALIGPALEDSGLSNDEIQILLMGVEDALRSQGAFDWLDPETGIVALSPRSKELLTGVIESLRAAERLTEDEVQQYNGMTE